MHAEYFLRLLLSSADFIKINFSKILTGTLSECQIVCLRSVGIELGPTYLQMLSADKERVGNLGNNE